MAEQRRSIVKLTQSKFGHEKTSARRVGPGGRIAPTTNPRCRRPALILAALSALVSPGVALAAGAVVLDGSVGRSGALQPINNIFSITPALGKQVGPNLIQSFSQLNLTAGQTASFSGSTSVRNVVARVTGGTQSSINGTLQCTISNANFFLVNPSGVIFGPNAALDLKGSFAVTTANVLNLANGGKIAASVNPRDSVLSSAAPAAFGFLGNSPAGLTLTGSTLSVPSGKSIVAAAGPVQFSGGGLSAPGGGIGLVSAASIGKVNFDPSSLAPKPVSKLALGAVALQNAATLATSGPAGGPISVQCGSLALAGGSSINSSTTGSGAGGAVFIDVFGDLNVSDSSITSKALTGSTGNAGPLTVNAATLELVDGGFLAASTNSTGNAGSVVVGVSGQATFSGEDATTGTSSGIFSRSVGGTGNGGNIALTAGTLQMTGGAEISTSTFGLGNAGAISVSVAGQAIISGQDPITDSGIYSESNATGSGGDAGSIVVIAGSLQMLGGAEITSTTISTGKAGNVTVDVPGAVLLSGADTSNFDTGIYAQSFVGGAGGDAGNIGITAGSLQMLGGAKIDSTTGTTGKAGNVTVAVSGAAVLSGADADYEATQGVHDSGIYAESNAQGTAGDAGNIILTAGSLQVLGGAEIISSTFTTGNAGSVVVRLSGAATLSGTDPADLASGVFADTYASGASGTAGTITMAASSLQVLDGAYISSTSFGLGNGGDINVHVSGATLLSQGSAPTVTGILADSNGTGASGDAGNIRLATGSLQVVGGAFIASRTFGSGKGGDVSVSVAGQATLSGTDSVQDSGILTDSDGSTNGGNGGDIALTAGSLQILGGAEVSSSTDGSGHGGNVSVRVAGQATVSGEGPDNGAGVYANTDSGASGDAGSISLKAGSLQVFDGAQITSSTYSSGNGGDVIVHVAGAALLAQAGTITATGIFANSNPNATGNAGSITLTAGNLQISDGSEVSSSTYDSGNGGDISLDVTGKTVISGTNSNGNLSGVFATSLATGTGGNAGNVTLSSASLQVLGGAEISSTTDDSGNGGDIAVRVKKTALISGAASANALSAILAPTNATGKAGNVTLTAGRLQLLGGGKISSASNASGSGGDVIVRVKKTALLSGAESTNAPSAILAPANATGSAGNVSVDAGRLEVLGGARIDSSTFGSGHGGSVNVKVSGRATISGGSPHGLSGVYADSQGSGDADSISFKARTLRLSDGGIINCDAFKAGNGGDLTVDAQTIHLSGGSLSAATGIGTGNAGNISVTADSLDISKNGGIETLTLGPGSAGSILVRADSIGISGTSSYITSLSDSTGTANSVAIHASSVLDMKKGILDVNAAFGKGGDLTVTGAALSFHSSQLLANSGAGFGGGTVSLKATDQVVLLDSHVKANGGGNGGNIEIDPDLAVLDETQLSANGGVNGGNITVHPIVLLKRNPARLITATGKTGFAGSISLTPPDLSLAGSLVLPTSLVLPGAQLLPQCGQMLDDPNASSFIVTGNGGAPPEPGGWIPSLNIQGPSDSAR